MIGDNMTTYLREFAKELEQSNFGFDPKLQKEIDSQISKALSNQDDILRKLTEEIRGLEDETDQSLSNEQKSLENNLTALEKSKVLLSEAQAEKVKASQMIIEEETEKLKLDQEVEELKKKAMTAVDMEKNFPNQRRLQSLLYKGTRVTWGKPKKGKANEENIIRGFVCNYNGTDVQTFELDKTNLSKKSVQDFVWDYIGAGVAKEWKKLEQ